MESRPVPSTLQGLWRKRGSPLRSVQWPKHRLNQLRGFAETKYVSTTGRNLPLLLLGQRSPLKLISKLLLYKSIPRPLLTDGTMVWSTTAKSHLDFLQKLQNRTLQLWKSARFVRNGEINCALVIPTLSKHIEKILTDPWHRIRASKNIRIQMIVEPDDRPLIFFVVYSTE